MPTEPITEKNEVLETDGAATDLAISGMTCGNCARHVAQAIQGVAGVRSVDVDLDAQQATVRWNSDPAPLAAVMEAVAAEGYGAKLKEPSERKSTSHGFGGWRVNVLLGVPVTFVLMLGEWGLRLEMEPWFKWFSFAAALAVQVFAGASFYRGAWAQLKALSSNMDTLVALGSTTAFAYSSWALFSGQPGHLYFMEAAAIITLISVGHWVESRVSVRASSALRKLLNLAPPVARRKTAEGGEIEVPVSSLQIGDVVLLRAGDRVPTDGTVLEGQSAVDESMLTGESIPVEKQREKELFAGTVNLNGLLMMRVTATGEQTALAHVIAAVQRAQNSRAGIQRIGDRISSVFVPVVVSIAVGAALWWGLAPESAMAVHNWLGQFLTFAHPPAPAAFIIAASVLIIACPCAMGLATPAAIMAGSNAAAQRGILVRDGVALEKAGKITAVVFDKTGTLTVGNPALVALWDSTRGPRELSADAPNSETKEGSPGVADNAARLAASLAHGSKHPVSQAIASRFHGRTPVKDWTEVHGAGVQAQLGAGTNAGSESALVRLGSVKWLKNLGVPVEAGADFVAEWSAQGATVVGLAVGNSLTGLFAVKDTLRPGAEEVIRQLHRQGLRTYLITGDNSITASSIGRQAGIEPGHVFSEVGPQKKAELIHELQDKGERVAFIGDGINDAPALEQADLGVAVSRASDIAREAADIILLKSDIQAVPESLGLARATLRTIKQNLFWAFFYNALGVPLAALGFMSPVLCAAAMGVSDLIVIGNALRLLRWKL